MSQRQRCPRDNNVPETAMSQRQQCPRDNNVPETGDVPETAISDQEQQQVVQMQYQQYHRQVMLWLVVSVLLLADDGFSEKDNEEALSEPLPANTQLTWPPANNAALQEPAPQSNAYAPWPAVSEWSVLDEEKDWQSRQRRSPPDPITSLKTSRRNRKKASSSRDCHMEKKEMRVRDLGLGFDSDEIILFKYCVGTCHSSRRNYDLALKSLVDNGSISSRRVSTYPCCRPTRYETVSFMDTKTIWKTIKWLSAANCSCVG
ncbi:persephin [Lampris incognitus]|uniref:persephin n=1 Tax=Lampris incognitus TaxID=2546036 RepID=UPI0024B54A92|nr:persephin [Lampris incognitus]